MFKPDFLSQSLKMTVSLKKEAKRLWTDSRSIEPGDLFAAIPGEKFDGHEYIREVAEKGALGAIVSKKTIPDREKLPPDFCLIEVTNTTEALRAIAKAHRRRLKGSVFAVAGSNGKTTTKEWLAFLFSELYGSENVFKTKKSNNSILGIAQTLLQIRNEKISVIEIGIDEPGWMEKHLDIVAPDHGVVTMIGEEHLNHLKNIETVAEEELKLLEFLRKKKGRFAANLDSPYIAKAALTEESLSYALEAKAQIEGRYQAPNCLKAFGLKWMNPLPGKHNAQNLLSAIACLMLVEPETNLETLKKLSLAAKVFEGEAHRGRWLSFEMGVRVFDDCYNANPESMERAIETFMELSDGCIQKLVLGDMLDLGDATERSHSRILNLALVSGADEIFLFGPQFDRAWSKAKALWPKDARTLVRTFTEFENLKAAVLSSRKRDDCFMLKGSRGMALERLLKIFEDQ